MTTSLRVQQQHKHKRQQQRVSNSSSKTSYRERSCNLLPITVLTT
jgi:hypothetical protein